MHPPATGCLQCSDNFSIRVAGGHLWYTYISQYICQSQFGTDSSVNVACSHTLAVSMSPVVHPPGRWSSLPLTNRCMYDDSFYVPHIPFALPQQTFAMVVAYIALWIPYPGCQVRYVLLINFIIIPPAAS